MSATVIAGQLAWALSGSASIAIVTSKYFFIAFS